MGVLTALGELLSPQYLLMMIAGTIGGIMIGAMPGLTSVMGVTLLSNMAAGGLPQPLSGAEVNEAADAAAPVFSEFILSCLESI